MAKRSSPDDQLPIFAPKGAPTAPAAPAPAAPRTSPARSFAAVQQVVISAKQVKLQNPVSWSLRTTGIATRVKEPPGLRARQAAFQVRASITQTVANLGLHLLDEVEGGAYEGLKFPGFLRDVTQTVDGKSVTFKETYADVLSPANVAAVLKGDHDQVTANADNASLFSDAVRSLETTTAMLRVLEGRVREVEDVIAICRRAQARIEEHVRAAAARGAEVDGALAEARHDVANTVALLDEEQRRVEATNVERERVLREEVPFVVFCRPRVADATDPLPVHDVEPALLASPALAVLDRPAPNAPEELREMVELARQLPARAFSSVAALVDRIERLDVLHRVLAESAARAKLQVDAHDAEPPPARGEGMQRVRGLVFARRGASLDKRRPFTQPVQVKALGWQQANAVAKRMLVLDDLLSSAATQAAVSRKVAEEVEQLYVVAANLYEEVGRIDPAVRLEWARLLSEHDAPRDLRELATLPRWAEIGEARHDQPADPFRKRELQAYVDWLYSRVDPDEEDAVAFIGDLVRVAVLVASHAPVERLLDAHVEAPTVVRVGGVLPLAVDPRRVRVGMTALVMVGSVVHARGVVEDLVDGTARARLVAVATSGATLSAGQAVRLVEAKGRALQAGAEALEQAGVPSLLPTRGAPRLR